MDIGHPCRCVCIIYDVQTNKKHFLLLNYIAKLVGRQSQHENFLAEVDISLLILSCKHQQ